MVPPTRSLTASISSHLLSFSCCDMRGVAGAAPSSRNVKAVAVNGTGGVEPLLRRANVVLDLANVGVDRAVDCVWDMELAVRCFDADRGGFALETAS